MSQLFLDFRMTIFPRCNNITTISCSPESLAEPKRGINK